MFISPSSPPAPLPDSVSSSTPNSGTFSTARTRLNYDQNLSRSRLSLKKKFTFPRTVGSLAEAADDVKEDIRFRGQRSGDHHCGAAGGGAVRPGQLKDWNNKQFYGQKVEDASSVGRKENINDRINRVTTKGQCGPSKFGGGDFNLNFSHLEEQETDILDTIDLSSTSPCTTPPPALEQRVLPHNIGFKNYGNTCYMNAVTQALLGLNIFVREMITRQNSHAKGDKGLLQAFSELCLACSKGETVSANQGMIEMKRQFELVDKQFEGNKMQDASEFLCRALEKMSEIELPRHPANYELSETTRELNIIENYFLHQKEEIIVCQGCKSETKCKHSDMTMWCDMVSLSSMTRTRSMSLQQLLEQSLAEEAIERRCEMCGCDEATTSSRLVKLPRVLVIILKRYRYNEQDQTTSNKVSRLVDIPETVSLTSLVSDNATLPSPSLLQEDAALPNIPVKTGHIAARVETPVKFRGLGVEEVEIMNEEDQMEYTMFVSQKEAVDNLMNRSEADEDVELKAALEASMVYDNLNHSDKSVGSPGKTPARKRSFGQLGGGAFTRGDGDKSHKKLNKAMDYLESKEFDAGKGSAEVAKKTNPRVRRSPRKVEFDEVPHPKSKEQEEADLQEVLELSRQELRRSPRKKVEFEEVPHPKSKEQEEADLQEALDLSRQEHASVLRETQFPWAMEDMENNNMEEVARPEHSYQLHSVVSHHGASARSGHYVADVFRFDVGGWRRYDDARVTTTDGLAVRTGSNTANGYILTYLHQAAWEEGRRMGSSHGNM